MTAPTWTSLSIRDDIERRFRQLIGHLGIHASTERHRPDA